MRRVDTDRAFERVGAEADWSGIATRGYSTGGQENGKLSHQVKAPVDIAAYSSLGNKFHSGSNRHTRLGNHLVEPCGPVVFARSR